MSERCIAKMIPPGIEPGTLSVLDSRDNRYTMESDVPQIRYICHMELDMPQPCTMQYKVLIDTPYWIVLKILLF